MLCPGLYYHIYNRANGNENLFRTDENYYFFLKKFTEHIHPIADTYAYCLMPNHFHFLLRIKDEQQLLLLPTFGKLEAFQKLKEASKERITETPLFLKHISKQFSNLFSSYTQSYNKVYQRKGSLFAPNFKYKHIDHYRYYTKVIHYIHANPVHHGFCKEMGEWKHSSYGSLLSAKNTHLMRADVMNWFGSPAAFSEFHSGPIDVGLPLASE